MRIVVTGAAGSIGRTLMSELPGLGWDVRGMDRVPAPNSTVADLNDAAALDQVLTGAEAIVHLAGQPTEAPWPVIRESNIDGAVSLFESARRVGVRRLVCASSNHAVGFTPVTSNLPAHTPPRPDTLYGVSKVFGEALARYYVDRYGMQVACLRIGTFAPEPIDRRSLSTWLSPGDCVRLVDACLRSDRLGFAILWGISANTRRTWDLTSALELGYQPQDDAEWYAAGLTEHDQLPSETDSLRERRSETNSLRERRSETNSLRERRSDDYVGGGFTDPGFGIDEVAQRWS